MQTSRYLLIFDRLTDLFNHIIILIIKKNNRACRMNITYNQSRDAPDPEFLDLAGSGSRPDQMLILLLSGKCLVIISRLYFISHAFQ